ncbi:SMI1/KNR4 family protein [Kiritimatiellaeota bacterium B1221]|nr:SMI1/KNR4 family protein [Kiritimatiellaeota bacterium B1221]
MNLYPHKECPWNSQTHLEHAFWEIGGIVLNPKGYQPAYVIISEACIPIVTAALTSQPGSKTFDHLYIRAGALDAAFLPLPNDCTVLYFVMDSGKGTTKSCISELRWNGTHEELGMLTQLMEEEASPRTVPEIRTFFRKNLKREVSSLIPLKPYQQHLYEYKGLKLGRQIAGDHDAPDHKLIQNFEHKSGEVLPEDYRDFLLKTNGGHLKNKVYFTAKGLRKKRELYSLEQFMQTESDFRNPWAYLKSNWKGFLTIGRDEKDEELVMCLVEPLKGYIFSVSMSSEGFWSETAEIEERAKARGVRYVASSFSDFVERLEVTTDVI